MSGINADDLSGEPAKVMRRQSAIVLEHLTETSQTESLPTRKFRFDHGTIKTEALMGAIESSTHTPVPNHKFVNNHIETSKYTNFTFLPKNLIEQLMKPANFYFVCIACLQSIPQVSISQGKPTILMPLLFIFFVSGVKDYMEDLKKKREDRRENEKEFDKLEDSLTGRWVSTQSQNLLVGDVIRISDGQRFPADLCLLGVQSQDEGGKKKVRHYCYVETSNIDGETNLKLKQVHPGFHSVGEMDAGDGSMDEFNNLKVTVHADRPNAKLDEFVAFLGNSEIHKPFGSEHILLRGSELRNSGKIYGMIVYTGFKSKIFMNNQARSMQKIKISRVEKVMNKFIALIAAFQFVMCIIMGVCDGFWVASNQDGWYLEFHGITPEFDAFLKFFTWFIIFANLIPISLLVTLEISRFGQMLFMQWDWALMKILPSDGINGHLVKPCSVQNSRLNEELGMVEFIFSDKTGTLTENSLDFRKCVIGSRNYGTGTTEIGRAARRRKGEHVENEKKPQKEHLAPHVYFDHRERVQNLLIRNPKRGSDEYDALQYFRCLTLNNTCFPVTEQTYSVGIDIGEKIEFEIDENFVVHVNGEGQRAKIKDGSRIMSISGNNRLKSPQEAMKLLEESEKPYMIQLKRTLSTPEFKSSSPDDEALVNFAHFCGVTLKMRKPPMVTISIRYKGEEKPVEEEWEELALLDFASHKKRMSVVMRNTDTGEMFAFIKGADSELANNVFVDFLDKEKFPHNRSTQKILDVYADEGLRTLLVGYAELDPEKFWEENWKQKWKEAEIQFRPNTMDRFDFESKLDQSCDYMLCGATAIEDKLQENVSPTIKSFLDAGMRFWILTGDKKETAKNVGVACDLLNPDMEDLGYLFQVDGLDGKTKEVQAEVVIQQIRKAVATMEKIEKRIENGGVKGDAEAEFIAANAGLLLTSEAFKQVCEHDEEVLEDFLNLSLMVKSVVACRLQPNQKSLIVQLIREKKRVITLAVGDGANDEPMIRTANVGVGIAGLEGTAAVRASDYAIGQFSFLKRLILVHGRNCYRRNSEMIYYILYKNAVNGFTYMWFAPISGFSGQPIYLEWAYQCYNIAYSCFPIFAYSMFDKDAEDDDLENNPDIYYLTNGNLSRKANQAKKIDINKPISKWEKYFDFDGGSMCQLQSLIFWLCEALATSAIITYFTLFSLTDITSLDASGQSFGLWFFGLANYTSVVFVVNLRLFFVFQSWTAIHIFTLLFSFFAYFFSMLVFSISSIWSTAGCDYYGMLFKMFKTERFWLTVLLTSVFSLMMISVIISYSRLFSKENKLNKRINELRETRRQNQLFHHGDKTLDDH